ncbi:MAG: lysine--tRNA ligase, partial [Methanobacteriota archaeon]
MARPKLFWADKKARQIVARRSSHIAGEVSSEEFIIKTSASISGVLHIGRLSDAIRGDTVCRALVDEGYKARLIWVAEDMDPLRRVPEGVPESYAEYIGLPVVKIPDPWGCHRNYADHHVSEYKEVLEEFLATKPEYYSMEEEYRKGSFREYVKLYLDKIDELREIHAGYRGKPLAAGWSPWLPVCKNCGRVITPRVERFEDGKVYYTCQDYVFEATIAKGCGYEGVANPLRDEGKLLWKGEWAAQWARWKVAAEGAGKEYNVPGSAWFVNAEIAAKILSYPPPEPIFYEHILFRGEKMSASHGNVIYPREWLETAPPEALRLLLLKKIGKTRNFDWGDLPRLVEEYDNLARWYQQVVKPGKEGGSREEAHRQRLYEMVRLPNSPLEPNPLPYSLAITLAQIVPAKHVEHVIKILKKLGRLG